MLPDVGFARLFFRKSGWGWVLTLPAAAVLSGLLYCLFHMFF